MDKPIICFVLSVDAYAKFVDRTIISAASVRALYSDIEIVLITDSHSVAVLENCGAMAKNL
jgi:hypothetical protein